VPLEFLHDGTDYVAHSYPLSRSVIDAPRNTDPICSGMLDRRWAQVADNLDRLTRGEPLINKVTET